MHCEDDRTENVCWRIQQCDVVVMVSLGVLSCLLWWKIIGFALQGLKSCLTRLVYLMKSCPLLLCCVYLKKSCPLLLCINSVETSTIFVVYFQSYSSILYWTLNPGGLVVNDLTLPGMVWNYIPDSANIVHIIILTKAVEQHFYHENVERFYINKCQLSA